jgi:hypothetical protein
MANAERWILHNQVTEEYALSRERIDEFIAHWDNIDTSFQAILARWMADELELDNQSFDNLGL